MPDSDTDFELLIGQEQFTHFIEGWVRREMESAADSFEFQYADLRNNLNDPIPIRPGQPCTIRLRDVVLVTGYIDDVAMEYDADQVTFTARGRSKTGDLVDSSAVKKTGRWLNAKLERIVRDICEPFDIPVRIDRKIKDLNTPFRRIAVTPGEACIDVIQRVCRLRACWPLSQSDGSLLITRPAPGDQVPVAIEYGKNVLRGERFDSWASRHSLYLLRGQVPSDSELNGRAGAELEDYVFDDGLDRYRPLLMVSTGQDRKGDLKRRAQWERNRRAGTGERWSYRIDGYGYSVLRPEFQHRRRDGFALWKPNELVRVVDPRLDTNEELLVASALYRWQADGKDGGRTVDLTLTRKEAFDIQPYPIKRRRKRPDPDRDEWQGYPFRRDVTYTDRVRSDWNNPNFGKDKSGKFGPEK